jgi:23S rRNA (uracil1939-C5)-methyltransferase
MSTIVIESLDHEGRGVGHVDGKAIFVEGALPGENVEYASYKRKARYEFAKMVKPVRASSQREVPRCQHFGYCGGCSMQHLNLLGQTAVKQRVLEDALWHIARIRPDEMLPPLRSADWGYRQRARFSIRNVEKKGGILLGFHEKNSSYVAVMDSCPILPPKVSRLIPALKVMVAELSNNNRIPQIEVACGDDQIVFVLRHLEPLSNIDREVLRKFADQHSIVWYLQPKGPETAMLFHPASARPLSYRLPEFSLSLEFSPTEFTQVNHGVNRLLVSRAMALLAPKSGERIADMFCGLGNFSFPIARMGAKVTGIEGSHALVARATKNAIKNGLSSQCEFWMADLFKQSEALLSKLGSIDKMLIDPPRDGAEDLVSALGNGAPRRIVYVSCQASTLARDAAILVHEKGYRLISAGIANMFPHTSHVETIAHFERE